MLGSAVTAQDVESVAQLTLHHPAHKAIPVSQTKHRFEILSRWNIPSGSRVLELGCGQGDCTAVLAHIVGPTGHVTAVDPGPINTYGKQGYRLVLAPY
jgi:predicted methyltransferase